MLSAAGKGEGQSVCVWGAQAEPVSRMDSPGCELRKGLLREGRDGRGDKKH